MLSLVYSVNLQTSAKQGSRNLKRILSIDNLLPIFLPSNAWFRPATFKEDLRSLYHHHLFALFRYRRSTYICVGEEPSRSPTYYQMPSTQNNYKELTIKMHLCVFQIGPVINHQTL